MQDCLLNVSKKTEIRTNAQNNTTWFFRHVQLNITPKKLSLNFSFLCIRELTFAIAFVLKFNDICRLFFSQRLIEQGLIINKYIMEITRKGNVMYISGK